jgi:hypothetical protein
MDLVLVIALSLVFNAIAYLFIRRQIIKKLNSKSYLSDLEAEVNTIVTELNSSTERNVQILEHKIAELKTLANRVDGTMATLTKELDQRKSSSERYNDLAKQKQVLQNSTKTSSSDRDSSNEIGLQMDLVNSDNANASNIQVERKTQLSTNEITSAAGTKFQITDEEKPKLSKRDRILNLYRNGKSALEISNETKIPLGEIELVLSLENN